MKEFFLYLLCGFLSGVPAGMGMGGGTLLIPALTIFLNVNQHSAQAVNLVSFIPMALIAVIIHAKNGYVKKKGLLFIILPAVVFAVLAGILAKNVRSEILKKIFGGFLILTSVFAFFADKFGNGKNEK